MSFTGISLSRLILIFLPFAFCFLLAIQNYLKNEKQDSELNQILKSGTQSIEDKNITRIIHAEDVSQFSFVERQNAKLNVLGIEYKFETLIGIAGALFIIGSILSVTLFRTGILLMIYLGCLCSASVFVYMNGLLDKKKQELTLEYLEKMRDIATFLSVGQSLNNAILEALESGNISKVMFRELDEVRRDIYTGTSISEAFMHMYRRLQIEDIKMYAETLAVFEETGGNLIMVMKANDQFATSKLELRNEQQIFVNQQKMSQKFIIGIPLGMIVFMFIFNPGFFGDFYSTLLGQFIAIVCITVLVVGVLLSNYLARKMD